jgi:hypothetical protein
MGQEEPFQMQTLSDREAPIPAVPVTSIVRLKSTLLGHSAFASGTALPAPFQPLAGATRIGAGGWKGGIPDLTGL